MTPETFDRVVRGLSRRHEERPVAGLREQQFARSGTSADEIELRSLERADNPFPDASPDDSSPVRGALTARV